MPRFLERTSWSVLVAFSLCAGRPAFAGDPRANARSITLAEALHAAEESAPDLVRARAQRARAAAARAAAAPWFPDDPTASLSAGPRISRGVGLDADVSIEQPLEIFGEQGLRRGAAERTAARIDADIDVVRFRVHRDVHAAFHLALLARERKALADEAVAFAESLASIAKKRVAAGEVSPLSTTLADAEVATAREAAVAAARDVELRSLELARVTGLSPVPALAPAGALETPRPAPAIDALVDLARAHQPDLRARDAAIREAESRLTLAEREALPKPTVGLAYGIENGFVDGEHILLGTLTVPIPLWRANGTAIAEGRAGVAEAEAAKRASLAALEATLLQGKTRVDANAERAAVFGAEVLPSAAAGLEKVRRAFELGEIDVLGVSVARERLLSLRREALDVDEAWFTAVGDLELAVGADVFPDSHASSSAPSSAPPSAGPAGAPVTP